MPLEQDFDLAVRLQMALKFEHSRSHQGGTACAAVALFLALALKDDEYNQGDDENEPPTHGGQGSGRTVKGSRCVAACKQASMH